MSTDFRNSETAVNLMRAFAGESQARNRYTFAAELAEKQNYPAIAAVFEYTAGQEKEHAEIFYNHLKDLAGSSIQIDGGYPVDPSDTLVQLLRSAQHNEYEEFGDAYPAFAAKASQEGFMGVAASFYMIADIEKTHGDRFGKLADLLEQGKLYVSDVSCKWVCLNCGHVYEGTEVPPQCPVCSHTQGYFIRLEFAPYSCTGCCEN